MRDGGRLGCLMCPGLPGSVGGLGWEFRGPGRGSIRWAFERPVPRRLSWRLGCSAGRWSVDCEGGGTCGVPGARLRFAGGAAWSVTGLAGV
jgi:hypothetical protein